MTTLRVIDLESTGLPPDAAICELAWQDVGSGTQPRALGENFATLVNPGRPIPPEASAIHHIVDADVIDAPTIEKPFLAMMDGADCFVAHNAAFDRAFFAGGDKPWICTLKAARRLWPEAPSHSNQALRYWRKLTPEVSRSTPPHRAGPDCYITALLLCELLKEASVEDMVQWTKEPSLLPRVTFGKHRGKKWSDLPFDYLDWIIAKSDLDEDTKFTAAHHRKAMS